MVKIQDRIICPGCLSVQNAWIERSDFMPFDLYVHSCEVCDYTIMEPEWDSVLGEVIEAENVTAWKTDNQGSWFGYSVVNGVDMPQTDIIDAPEGHHPEWVNGVWVWVQS